MQKFDLIVIGTGPAGYVAAIRAAQLGLSVACVDKQKSLGGTCLNVGCIPSKALLHTTELYWKMQHEASHLGLSVERCSYSFAEIMNRKSKVVANFNEGIVALLKKNKIAFFHGSAKFLSKNTIQREFDSYLS